MSIVSDRLNVVSEGGSKKIRIDFYDENNSPITPKTITWSLQDSGGNYVNSREDVSGTPASTFRVRLQGNDINLSSNPDKKRIFTLKYTYDSANWGSDTAEIIAADFIISDSLDV